MTQFNYLFQKSIKRLTSIPWSSTVFSNKKPNETWGKSLTAKEPVPDVMVTFGNPPNHMTFASHPGVMAVVKLLEMKYLVVPRAVLTQENVDAIHEFDPVLANKCQIAVDGEIDINFMDLEYIHKPEFLQKFLQEKELITMARREVLDSPPGVYRIPYYAREWEKPEPPRSWRPETNITADILAVEPDLIKDIQLQQIVNDYLKKKPIDEHWESELQDPIVAAAEQPKYDTVHPLPTIKRHTTTDQSLNKNETVPKPADKTQ